MPSDKLYVVWRLNPGTRKWVRVSQPVSSAEAIQLRNNGNTNSSNLADTYIALPEHETP